MHFLSADMLEGSLPILSVRRKKGYGHPTTVE
jgi:hypothetical protein